MQRVWSQHLPSFGHPLSSNSSDPAPDPFVAASGRKCSSADIYSRGRAVGQCRSCLERLCSGPMSSSGQFPVQQAGILTSCQVENDRKAVDC